VFIAYRNLAEIFPKLTFHKVCMPYHLNNSITLNEIEAAIESPKKEKSRT
jgi:hypothetical protein